MIKIIKKIPSILGGILIAIELAAIVFIVAMRLSGGVPSVLGYNLFVIVSPSMEPEICVDDIILSKVYDGGEIHVDDVVTYYGTKGDLAGKMVTHKVVYVSEDSETIITRGVANSDNDPAISKSDVQSVMVYKTFLVGKIYKLISSTWGFILFVLIPMMALIVSEIVNLVKDVRLENGEEEYDKQSEDIKE